MMAEVLQIYFDGSSGRICPWMTAAVKESFWEILYLILMMDGGLGGGGGGEYIYSVLT